MFKSIDYKLYFYLLLLIIAVSSSVFFFLDKEYIYCIISIFFFLISLYKLYQNYQKYNKNVLFLLNALDNGDYSFNFAETKLSRREKELNQMMNRIKDILSKAKQEVIEKEKFLSLVIENVPIGIIIIDKKNNVRNANKASSQLLGLPIFTHLNQLINIDTELPQLFRNLQVNDEHKQIKIIKERDIVQISLSVSQIKIQDEDLRIITLNNIGSEIEKSEIESWIKLIRVMTHEIMNSIAPITSLSEMLLFSFESTSNSEYNEMKEVTIDSLSTINTTAKGLASFVESYRQFLGIAQPTIISIDLLPFIDSILHLEKAEMESNSIEVILNSKEKKPVILGDNIQLSRVIVNLLKNAIEALEGKKEKKIKIDILSENEDKIQINIANNGEPIPSSILENIFIPFFTTKNSGSGIGLSVSRYIMRLHEGNLKHFYTDGWTTFSLTFKTPSFNANL